MLQFFAMLSGAPPKIILNSLIAGLVVLAILRVGLLPWQPARAESAGTEVDAILVLAVDVSRSMSPRELEIQRRGYAEALVSDDVIKAIQSGLLGRVALIYFEWSGNHSNRIIVDWSVINSREQAEAFADQLTAEFNSALRRTSISGAIDYAVKLINDSGFVSNRRIIDISGDGPNNQGRPVVPARDDALAQGIVINGLPLMTREGMGSQFHLDNLDEYYTNCVIGGPGSFVVPVLEWDQFPVAVRQKLILELAATEIPVKDHRLPFLKVSDNAYDCLIGEKIWELFREQWQNFP